jgi:cell division protease FtsH
LVKEAQAARNQAVASLIESQGQRIMVAFLGRDDYEKVEDTMSMPLAHLMLECLPAMIHERGGQVVWSVRMAYPNQAVNATLHTAKVGGQSRLILHEGHLFIHLPDELVVVSADPVCRGDVTVMNVGVRSSVDPTLFLEKWTRYAREHNYLRGHAFFADGVTIERNRRYGWDDILLSEQAKQTIRTHVDRFLNNRLRLRALGVKMRRGLILAGPPGTGKTLLGKVLSDTLDVSFLWVSPRHVRSATSFEEIMSLARFVAPVVVFLEDLDLFAEERDGNNSMGLGELMNQLDGAVDNEDIVTIATTNRLEEIEKALRNRPGRFDRIVHIGEMDEPCRRQMLSRLLSKAVVEPGDLDHLVAATASYTGAQIEELANTIFILAVDKTNQPVGEDAHQPVSVDRGFIETALQEVQVERKARLGFHAA